MIWGRRISFKELKKLLSEEDDSVFTMLALKSFKAMTKTKEFKEMLTAWYLINFQQERELQRHYDEEKDSEMDKYRSQLAEKIAKIIAKELRDYLYNQYAWCYSCKFFKARKELLHDEGWCEKFNKKVLDDDPPCEHYKPWCT